MKTFVTHTEALVSNRASRRLRGLDPERRNIENIASARERNQLRINEKDQDDKSGSDSKLIYNFIGYSLLND